jgi:glycosyltransferase involved in cell wall biosynthesis
MKDRFDVACDLLRRAAERGADFRFHVFGFTREEFLYSIPMLADSLEVLGDRIVFHGMKPMEEVQAAVSEADYTILIREKNRVTTAGFPTKVSESITCGTPVITTRTSDIDKYLQEGRGAFFFDLEDSEAAKEKLIELLRKNVTERSKQKAECDRIEAFDPSTYLDKIRSFLCEVLGPASEAGEKRRKDGGS